MNLEKFQELIEKEKKIVREMQVVLRNLEKAKSSEDKRLINSHLVSLKKSLRETGKNAVQILSGINVVKSLQEAKQNISATAKQPEQKKVEAGKKSKIGFGEKRKLLSELEVSSLEKTTLKRLKEKEEEIKKQKIKKPSLYVKNSSKFFSKFSGELADKKSFISLKRDLIKANIQLMPKAYISVMLFTTFLSIFAGILIFIFFLFFSIGGKYVVMRVTESFDIRLLKTFWILFAIPIGTFVFMFFYPSMEKKSAETKINQELPFAAIHMASISGSMIDPSKIFSIIISTGEYPHLSREFTKLINEINIYGYDLVSALRKVAFDSPSGKLSELLNGLATTITSGGDLPAFFDKRAQTLLFDHKLEREKYTKSAETFMDIYISVVIAAPMILMVLLMMMKISGLGISLSTTMITLIMVLGVSAINVVFLTFLYLKQPGE